ncbi:MAG: hypothetical protein RL199_228 [Pseudomonadota bacterium]|jgi:hypothetical protein
MSPAAIREAAAPGVRRARLLVPVVLLAVALGPRLSQLSSHLVDSYAYAFDSHTLLYLSHERMRSLLNPARMFDFAWMHPYPQSGTYMDPVLLEGLMYGLGRWVGLSEPAAFNAAMAAILLLNHAACVALFDELGGAAAKPLTPWLAAAAAFSPYAWSRFGAPTNTLFFPGLFALALLVRATDAPRWRHFAAACAGIVLQAWSSLYVFMFFTIVGLGVVPALAAAAHRRGTLRTYAIRLCACLAAALPLLGWLWGSYAASRREMGADGTYDYVSSYYPLTFGELATARPFDCRLAPLGFARGAEACGEQTFPGHVLLVLAGLVVAFAAWRAVRRWPETWRIDPHRALVPPVLLLAATVAALALSETWPMHLVVWSLLAWPSPDGRGPLIGRRPLAVAGALVLLVTDVALNPVVPLPGRPLGSIHRLLFMVIPGMGGLRSEYRIVLFLPVLLALVALLGLPRVTVSWPAAARRAAVALVAAGCFLESQPSWQRFFPTVRSADAGPVLEAARALPASAVLAVLKGEGAGLAAPTDADASFFDALIVAHGHRTVTGYSTFVPPGPAALRRAADLSDAAARLPWTARLAVMLGATHLIVDWSEGSPPPPEAMEAALQGLGRVVETDSRRMLVALRVPEVQRQAPPLTVVQRGAFLSGRPQASFKGNARRLVDKDPATRLASEGPQAAGDWVRLSFAEPHRVSVLEFTPRYNLESLPYAYVVEVLDPTGHWLTLHEQRGWVLPPSLIERPGTGVVSIPLPPVPATALRLRLLEGTPFRWSLASFEVFGT